MKGGIILTALGAAAAYLFFRGKSDMINQLQINLTSLKLNLAKTRSALFLNLFFDVRIKIQNPTNSSIKINHVYIEIFVNGKPLGGVTKPESFTISVNSSTDINFTAKLQTGTIVNQIIDILQNGSAEDLQISGEGYIETSLGRIPFKKSF